MLFEFQFRLPTADWEKFGTAATPGDRFDIEEAAVVLRDSKGGRLPEGEYRVRAVEIDDGTWQSAKVDEHGIFKRVET
jgi:hypothetical protein